VTAIRHSISVARWKLEGAVESMQSSVSRYRAQPTYVTVVGDTLTRPEAENHLSRGCAVRVQVVHGHIVRDERTVAP